MRLSGTPPPPPLRPTPPPPPPPPRPGDAWNWTERLHSSLYKLLSIYILHLGMHIQCGEGEGETKKTKFLIWESIFILNFGPRLLTVVTCYKRVRSLPLSATGEALEALWNISREHRVEPRMASNVNRRITLRITQAQPFSTFPGIVLFSTRPQTTVAVLSMKFRCGGCGDGLGPLGVCEPIANNGHHLEMYLKFGPRGGHQRPPRITGIMKTLGIQLSFS